LAAVNNHGHHVASKIGVSPVVQVRWRPKVDPRFGFIIPGQRKGAHAEPLCSEILLDGALGVSALVDGINKLEEWDKM
jgi:hypothetical protein